MIKLYNAQGELSEIKFKNHDYFLEMIEYFSLMILEAREEKEEAYNSTKISKILNTIYEKK